MKYAESVSKLAEQYVEEAMHEGGDACVADPGLMKQVLEDFAMYLKYSVDADVPDEMTPDGCGTNKLYVLTDEERGTLMYVLDDWMVMQRGNGYERDDFDYDTQYEDYQAVVEAAGKLEHQMVEEVQPQ